MSLDIFSISWHQPIEAAEQFACRKEDLGRDWRRRSSQASRHAIQEAEANRFAIELLAPEKFVRPFMSGVPDLAKALRLSCALNLSREAAARRYTECHDTPTGLVFSRDGVIATWSVGTISLHRLWSRRAHSEIPPPTGDDNLSDHVEADACDWLSSRPSRVDLIIANPASTRRLRHHSPRARWRRRRPIKRVSKNSEESQRHASSSRRASDHRTSR